MEDFSNIMNWDNYYKNIEVFKNNKPFRFAFVEEAFQREFYEKLYETYPTFDESWTRYQNYGRSSKTKEICDLQQYVKKDNPDLSKEWNLFVRYMSTDEFVKNISKFTGIDLKKIDRVGFINSHKGDFSLPHIDGYHNDDGSISYKITILMYFNKGWQKGDPGGTYMCEKEDENSIIFEPYNLDNSLMCFEESKDAWHGSRFITKDVKRQALSFGMV